MVNPQPYSVAAYASALNGQSHTMMSNNPIGKVRPRPHQSDPVLVGTKAPMLLGSVQRCVSGCTDLLEKQSPFSNHFLYFSRHRILI